VTRSVYEILHGLRADKCDLSLYKFRDGGGIHFSEREGDLAATNYCLHRRNALSICHHHIRTASAGKRLKG
jgi:hypothetical protein